MNDSFLEDLELVRAEQKAGSTVHHAERNITRRRSQPSPQQHQSLEQDELNNLLAKQNVKKKIVPSIVEAKLTQRRSLENKDIEAKLTQRKSLENTDIVKDVRKIRDTKPDIIKPKSMERKTKPLDNKLKPVENTESIVTLKPKIDKKDRSRFSNGSNKESSHESSSKENSRPSDSSKESVTRRRSIDALTRNAEESFQVELLKSMKEIVKTYTEVETTKILRTMQELHINSQSHIIKLMIQQTDDIAIEAGDKSPRLKSLAEENERLKENIVFLEARNDELWKTIEEHERENLRLKNRCNELLKSGAAMEINCYSDGSSKENNRPSGLHQQNGSPKILETRRKRN